MSPDSDNRKPRRWLFVGLIGLCVIALSILGILEFETSQNVKTFWPEAVAFLKSLNLDVGGFLSLIATAILVLIANIGKTVRENLKVDDRSVRVVILALSVVGFLGIWLSVRTIGLSARNYLSAGNLYYTTTDIFTIIGFILASNLCFSLTKTLATSSRAKEENKEPEKNPENPEPKLIPKLVGTLLQATIIGTIVFMPRYADVNLLFAIGGRDGYVLVLSAFLIAIAVLSVVWDRTRRSSTQEQKVSNKESL